LLFRRTNVWGSGCKCVRVRRIDENESYHMHEWIMLRTGMRDVTPMNASCHADVWTFVQIRIKNTFIREHVPKMNCRNKYEHALCVLFCMYFHVFPIDVWKDTHTQCVCVCVCVPAQCVCVCVCVAAHYISCNFEWWLASRTPPWGCGLIKSGHAVT